MMELELKGELPAPRSFFSIFDQKIHLAIYGSSLGSYRIFLLEAAFFSAAAIVIVFAAAPVLWHLKFEYLATKLVKGFRSIFSGLK